MRGHTFRPHLDFDTHRCAACVRLYLIKSRLPLQLIDYGAFFPILFEFITLSCFYFQEMALIRTASLAVRRLQSSSVNLFSKTLRDGRSCSVLHPYSTNASNLNVTIDSKEGNWLVANSLYSTCLLFKYCYFINRINSANLMAPLRMSQKYKYLYREDRLIQTIIDDGDRNSW